MMKAYSTLCHPTRRVSDASTSAAFCVAQEYEVKVSGCDSAVGAEPVERASSDELVRLLIRSQACVTDSS